MSETGVLVGRHAIIELFDRCALWPRPVRGEQGRKLPIVVLVGPAGSGKTALLDELKRRSEALPHAELDMMSSRVGLDSPRAVMLAIVQQLSVGRHGIGRLRFPRFWLGLLVSELNVTGLTSDELRMKLRDLPTRIWPFRRLRPVVRDAIDALAHTVSGLPAEVTSPLVVHAIEATLRGWRKPGLSWWQRRGTASNAFEALVEFRLRLDSARERDLRAVERTLCEALLADLRAAYGNSWRGPDRTVASAVFLDNAHTESGRAFLRLLAEVRAHWEGAPDPLVVMASSGRDWFAGHRSGGLVDVDAVDYETWCGQVTRYDPDSRLMPIRLRDLTEPEVKALVGTGADANVSRYVHQLTGGHPGGAAEVVRLLGEREQPVPREVLDLPESATKVANRLLDELLADFTEDLRTHLVTVSAARVLSANTLHAALRYPGSQGDRDTSSRISDHLRERMWQDASDEAPRMHPWLRRLLLISLEDRAETDPSSWAEVHARLRDHHRAEGNRADELYHELALHNVERVCRELDALLDDDLDPSAWLAELRHVTEAPNRLPRTAPVHRDDLTAWAIPESRRMQALAAVVTDCWVGADPLGDPRNDSTGRLARDLDWLSDNVPSARGTLFNAAQQLRLTTPAPGFTFVPETSRAGSGTRPTVIRPPRSWRKTAGRATTVVVVAALSFAVVITARELSDRCGDGVRKEGPADECVGVTDGSYVFFPELAKVEDAIFDENESVDDGGERYVSIVYALAMPRDKNTALGIQPIVRDLQGAYIAQYEANRLSSESPKIKLFIANLGAESGQWSAAVDRIEDMIDSEHVAVVAGLGQSHRATFDTLRRLSNLDLATMAAVVTADSVRGGTTDDAISGFARVSSTTADEAAAALAALPPAANAPLLVRDSDPDDEYARGLAEKFIELRPDAGRPETYDSSDLDVDVSNRMRHITTQICASRFDQVFFAGRSDALRDLVVELGERNCNPNFPITVVTGTDASTLTLSSDDEIDQQFATAVRDAQVTVLFTGHAHPDQWRDRQADDAQQFIQFRDRFNEEFPDSALDDGQAMMAHDAVAAAVQAIRDGGEAGGNLWLSMHGPNRLNGVTGPIDLDDFGNTIDKPVPILRIEPDGSRSFVRMSDPRQ